MEYIKKAIKLLRARGLRAFITAVRIKLGRMMKARRVVYENVDVLDWLRGNFSASGEAQSASYDYAGTVCLIVPVYNGFEYFDALFGSIPKTRLRYKLIIVDDCSTDERVLPYLRKLTEQDSRVQLIENAENLGFVKTVNKALRLAEDHVALLNTDVELPEYWLERLMYPIIHGEKVASSTPFTNSGVICSFPDMGCDNPLFEGLSLAQIDEAFSRIKPSYNAMPTGVGNCMGMNFDVIRQIGIFDEAAYSRGYGEENDWCQKAIKKGYRNVMVENLFIYHKHGGSFTLDEKKKLMARNSEVLAGKHPNYGTDVTAFFEKDPARHVRNFAAMYLLCNYASAEQIIALTHSVGGGASVYLNNTVKTELRSGNTVITVCFEPIVNKYLFEFRGSRYRFVYKLDKISDLREITSYLPCSAVYVNNLVEFLHLYDTLDDIVALKEKKQSRLKMFVHDYYPVCPTVNLLDRNGKYCGVPERGACSACFDAHDMIKQSGRPVLGSIKAWRDNWAQFLEHCDDITVFSGSTKQILERVYGKNIPISVVPHRVNYIPRLDKTRKTTATLNIGLIGVLAVLKGSQIVQDMISLIEKQNLNINIVLIGYAEGFSSTMKKNHHYFETGKYAPTELASLTLQHDIDVFLISSICPETFSFTCEEAMEMNMPVACFNIGAPAERVAVYSKGLIIDEIEASAALEQLQRFAEEVSPQVPRPEELKRVLFVIEQESFSSRYRVEHFREQLMYLGIPSDKVMAGKVKDAHASIYDAVVIYRCPHTDRLGSFIDICRASGKKVFYDIDDFIFDFDKIKHLEFLRDSEYTGYEEYTKKIRACMELCDGHIVSTNHLAEAISGTFNGKPVYINRNVASLEMLSASMAAVSGHRGISSPVRNGADFITLIYYSGTKTHDKDFALIGDVLIKLLDRYECVSIKLVGPIKTEKCLEKYEKRIQRVGFVSWQELPALLAAADINLMPLEDDFFHRCKSENKWMEAALVDVPTVCSRNPELEAVIEHGITGFLCRDAAEWEQALVKLIESRDLREKIGKAAGELVREKYITINTGQSAADFVLGS